MIVHTNASSVGALISADSNSQSFRPPQQRQRRKKLPEQTGLGFSDDSVSFDLHSASRDPNDGKTASLVKAISFSQAQDGLLQKLQLALQQMRELATRATSSPQPEQLQLDLCHEFTDWQCQIQSLEAKMLSAAGAFNASIPASGIEAACSESFDTEDLAGPPDSFQPICDKYQVSAASINNTASASEAKLCTEVALNAVTTLRAQLASHIERLTLAGDHINSIQDSPVPSENRIKDMDVAQASTWTARYNILVQSGTAMLAQANALPESALRLLT